jgi:DNA-binding NtrC family response regulator
MQEKEITRLGSSKAGETSMFALLQQQTVTSVKWSLPGTFVKICCIVSVVVNIHDLPPLRQRRGDLPILCRTLLKRIGDDLGRPELKLSQTALEILQKQEWPGNIRQLKNALERAVVLSDSSILEPADFLITDSSPDHGRSCEESAGLSVDSGAGLNAALENLERRLILEALSESAGVKSGPQKYLKIPRTSFCIE